MKLSVIKLWSFIALLSGLLLSFAVTAEQKQLREFYVKLMTLSATEAVFNGAYQELHSINKATQGYSDKTYAFARFNEKTKVIVASNFASTATSFALILPKDLVQQWKLSDSGYELKDLLSERKAYLKATADSTSVQIELAPLESVVLKF